MKMKKITLAINCILLVQVLLAQTKKEQITLLENRVDSLFSILSAKENEIIIEKSKNNDSDRKLIACQMMIDEAKIKEQKFKDSISQLETQQLKNTREIESLQNLLVFYRDSLNNLKQDTESSMISKLVRRNDSFLVINPELLTKTIKQDSESCTDCFWYEYVDEEIGDLLFIHCIERDLIYFIYDGTEYEIPLVKRNYKEAFTETDKPIGSGQLTFQGSGFRINYNFSNAGHTFGEEGYLDIYRNEQKLKTFYIRSNF